MKQQILNLKKKLLLVELPEGASNVQVIHGNNVWYEISDGCPKWLDELDIKIAKIKSLIGKLTDITEEQFEKWVGSYEWEDTPDGCRYAYRDYKDGEETDDYWDMYPFDTAKESFFSYLEKEGIYFSNPLEKPIMEEYGYCEDRDAEGHLYKSYWEPQDGEEKWQESINEWWEAEEKVWNLNSCYIFEII